MLSSGLLMMMDVDFMMMMVDGDRAKPFGDGDRAKPFGDDETWYEPFGGGEITVPTFRC